MTYLQDDIKLQSLRAAANEAERQLLRAVVDMCPGDHKPVQHRRDRMVPWCKACGRTTRGLRIHSPEEK